MKTKLKLIAAAMCTFLTFGAVAATDTLTIPGKIRPTVNFCKEYASAVYQIARVRNVNTIEEIVELIESTGAEPRAQILMIKSAAHVYDYKMFTATEHKNKAFSECLVEMVK